MKPYTTCTPARSSALAHIKFCSSSNRAFNSITAVTDLPASAASMSARMIADCLPARYSVCLIAITSGSAAACWMNSTTTSKLSYG